MCRSGACSQGRLWEAIVHVFPAALDPRRISHSFGVNGRSPLQCESRPRHANGGLAPASAALLLWWLSLRWCAQFKRAGPGQRMQVCQGETPTSVVGLLSTSRSHFRITCNRVLVKHWEWCLRFSFMTDTAPPRDVRGASAASTIPLVVVQLVFHYSFRHLKLCRDALDDRVVETFFEIVFDRVPWTQEFGRERPLRFLPVAVGGSSR